MRRRIMAFSRDSTGDSDIPSSCEMKHEPEFKPLQGSPAFFWVRVSRGPFHLRQKTQGPSHIPIAEGNLHLSCWWKVGSNLQSKTGNQHSSCDDMGCMELSSSSCTDINIHINLWRMSQAISVDSSISQATCTVCCGTRDSNGENEGKWASSCVGFGYTDLFCIPELTSEFISSSDSVLGDSLVLYQENRGSLRV